MALPSNPLKAIFAILSLRTTSPLDYEFLGTGFYVDASGLFLTAKHVCEGVTKCCAAMLSTEGVTTYPITDLRFSERYDIALGKVNDIRDIQHLEIATKKAPMNYDVITTEYSGTHLQLTTEGVTELVLEPYYRKGQVVHHYMSNFPEQVPTECFELSFAALKGASGAPVVLENNGLVLGMIVGNVQHELLPSHVERITKGETYVEEIKYVLPSAKAISWRHLKEFIL